MGAVSDGVAGEEVVRRLAGRDALGEEPVTAGVHGRHRDLPAAGDVQLDARHAVRGLDRRAWRVAEQHVLKDDDEALLGRATLAKIQAQADDSDDADDDEDDDEE